VAIGADGISLRAARPIAWIKAARILRARSEGSAQRGKDDIGLHVYRLFG
jgi:hypothetical protein